MEFPGIRTTSNLLLHSLAKCESSTIKLYSKVIQFKVLQNSSLSVNVY